LFWVLWVGDQRLDDFARRLHINDGAPAVIYYADEGEEFEWDGRLWHRPTGPSPEPQWVAIVDEATFRRIR
jgi:hypothetical protein